MYNEEIKQRFFKENPELTVKKSSRGWLFDALAKSESECGKDIAQMNLEETKRAISSIGIEEISSMRGYISFLRRYVKWCEDCHALSEISDGVMKVTIDDIDFTESLRRVLFKDENDLVNSIRLVRSLDEGHVDVPVLILGWIGLTRKEIAALRDRDVDLSDRVIYATDGSVLAAGLSDLVVDVLRRYRDCKKSERENGLRTIEVFKDLSVDSFLKRMAPRGSKRLGTEYSKLQIDAQLSKLAVRYEDLGYPRRHTFTNVWRSGRFRKLWEIEQSGVDVISRENRPVVESVMRDRKNYYNAVKMYECYKKAFYTE